MLLIIAFYLYALVKLPWDLYVSSKMRRQSWNRVAEAYIDQGSRGERVRNGAIWQLWALEWVYFVMVFACPFAGALFLRYIRPHLHVY